MYEDIFEQAFNGDAAAQSVIGDKFYKGDGVPQSYSAAFIWYQKAAHLCEYWSCFAVAKCYHLGQGVDTNPEEAAKWCHRAYEIASPQWIATGLQPLPEASPFADASTMVEAMEKASSSGSADELWLRFEQFQMDVRAQQAPKQHAAESAPTVSPRVENIAMQYGTLRRRYFYNKMMSKLTWGKRRRHYKARRRAYQHALREIRRFWSESRREWNL